MAIVGRQLSAKNSRVQVIGQNLRLATWRATWRGDDIDTTNFESGGWEQGTIGINVMEWTMGGDWDTLQNPLDPINPPGLYPRDDLGIIRFYEEASANVFHYSAVNRVLSAENGGEVKGKVTFNASGKTQGVSYVQPTG